LEASHGARRHLIGKKVFSGKGVPAAIVAAGKALPLKNAKRT
jgi:hypothetical protein